MRRARSTKPPLLPALLAAEGESEAARPAESQQVFQAGPGLADAQPILDGNGIDRQQVAPIRRPGRQADDVVLRRYQATDFLPAGDLPNADHVLPAGGVTGSADEDGAGSRRQARAVRAPAQAAHRELPALQHVQWFSIGGIPQAYQVSIAGCQLRFGRIPGNLDEAQTIECRLSPGNRRQSKEQCPLGFVHLVTFPTSDGVPAAAWAPEDGRIIQ
jgi:hypothetical protein